MFKLTNARGETVDINTPSLRSYTPTGLGLQITNSYSPYETYFIPTKSVLSQGIMQVYMKFGDIESQSYQSFYDFAQFLAYQPYTLEYDFDDNTYYRDARLQSLTKTEIGGSTIDAFDRLNEIFTLEFINNWYNNKTAEYKSYDPDPNLGTYGKGYSHRIYDKYTELNSQGQKNEIVDSGFLASFNAWHLSDNSGVFTINGSLYGSEIVQYNGSKSTRVDITSTLIPYNDPNQKVSIRIYLKGSGAIQLSGYNGNDISGGTTSWGSWKQFSYSDWTYFELNDISIDSGDVSNTKYIALNLNSTGTAFSFAQDMLVLDTYVGDYVEGPTYGYDYQPTQYAYFYAPYYVYQESNRPSNEKVMSLNNKSQYFGLQSGSPSVITVNGPCSVNPTWTVVQNGNVVATDGFVLTLTDNQKLVVSSYPEDQYARIYNPDGSYVDVSQLQDYTKTNFVQIPEGESTVLFYLDANSDVNITFKEERLLV